MNKSEMKKTAVEKRLPARTVIKQMTVVTLSLTACMAGRLQAAPPDAAAVLDRFVEVTGGKAAYDAVRTRLIKQRVVHVGMGFEDRATIYSARPNKNFAHIESDAMGTIEHGCDGQYAWFVSEQAGTIVEEGEALVARMRAAEFNGHVQWRELYDRVEYEGTQDVDGAKCDVVRLFPVSGKPETHYYDSKSGLLLRVEKPMLTSGMPSMNMDIRLSDYREVDGLLLPHKRHRSFDQCGSKREMTFITDSIEHNVKFAADRFEPPAGVKQEAAVNSLAKTIGWLLGVEPVKKAPCQVGGIEAVVEHDGRN